MGNPDFIKMGKAGVGRALLSLYLTNGKRLTPTSSIIAKCYECMAGYVDGRRDCQIVKCPLYPYMPYRGKEDDPSDKDETLDCENIDVQKS